VVSSRSGTDGDAERAVASSSGLIEIPGHLLAESSHQYATIARWQP
jgi:hypothetical protein